MDITFETVVFYALALFISVCSVLTVTTKRLLRSATYLLFVLFGTAGVYFLFGYTFLGSVQIMVYAGGVVVLYVFSIFLTSGEGEYVEKLKRSRFLAGLITTVIGGALVLFITLSHKFSTVVSPQDSPELNMKAIGNALLGGDKYGYVLPFEAVSILLLACIIGGILIARKDNIK
jgi:NADH-quinone oxidoreductase subunit J